MRFDVERLRAALAAEKTAIHCDTPEKAEALFEAMGWNSIVAGHNVYHRYEGQTCLTRCGSSFLYGSREYYLSQNYTILPLDDFILSIKPRLAEILGVEVGQEFCNAHPDYRGNEYRVTEEGALEWRSQGAKRWNDSASTRSLTCMINNPDLLRIIPRWTDADIEDAKAVRRLFPEYEWVARDVDGRLWVYETRPYRRPQRENACFAIDTNDAMLELPGATFPSVTWDNSPIELEDIK